MIFTLFGNLCAYSLLQHEHTVFLLMYCVVCTRISSNIKSLAISSFSTVLHPHVHVATFATFIISSGYLLTFGADLSCSFSLPGLFPDFTRLFNCVNLFKCSYN